MYQVWIYPDIQVLCQAVSQLNSALDLLYKSKNDSIPREINMVREAAQNTIGHIKDNPNDKNKIVERYKRELIYVQ